MAGHLDKGIFKSYQAQNGGVIHNYCKQPFKARPWCNKAGQVGIGCGINNVQKICDGEVIGINSRPEDDFTIIEDSKDLII